MTYDIKSDCLATIEVLLDIVKDSLLKSRVNAMWIEEGEIVAYLDKEFVQIKKLEKIVNDKMKEYIIESEK